MVDLSPVQLVQEKTAVMNALVHGIGKEKLLFVAPTGQAAGGIDVPFNQHWSEDIAEFQRSEYTSFSYEFSGCLPVEIRREEVFFVDEMSVVDKNMLRLMKQRAEQTRPQIGAEQDATSGRMSDILVGDSY